MTTDGAGVPWGIPGLAQLFDIVLDAAGERRRLSLGESEQFHQVGRLGAEGGIPLSNLIEEYLGGAGELWEQVLLSADPDHRVEVGRALRQVSEDAVAGLAAGFEEGQRRSIRAEESSRREFLDDLLSVGPNRGLTSERADRVEFGLGSSYSVAVVDAAFRFSDTGPIHARVRTGLASRSPTRRFAVFTRSGRLVVVGPDCAASDLAPLIQTLGEVDGLDWRVGIGEPATGLVDIVDAYHQALEAIRLARLFGLGRTADHADLLAYRVLAGDRNAAPMLARTIMGQLGSAPRLELERTLGAFIERGGNLAEVARDLGLGPRTVGYRLDRIAQLTGHSPRTAEGRFVLEMAFRARPLTAVES